MKLEIENWKLKIFAKGEEGIVAISITIVILLVGVAIVLGLVFVFLNSLELARNIGLSEQAYFAAESGVEDALLRLNKGKNIKNSYSFAVDSSSVNIELSPIIGGSRTITADGNTRERLRKVRIIHQIDTTEVSVNYGAQIGEGGLFLNHNQAQIIGNVFSNGDVTGKSAATIANSLIVSGAGNSVEEITVLEDVNAYSCLDDADISGNLEYNENGTNDCDVSGTTTTTSEVINNEEFAITPTMINDWKNDAEDGGVISGDYTVDSDETLGPVKIEGDLHLDNNVTLTMEGTIWVTGDFTSAPNATIKLDPDYGELSGIIIMDGVADVANNLILQGSGAPGSFLAFISTNSSLSSSNPAMEISNNADNAILFAPNGLLLVSNNAAVVEVMAYRLEIRSATVEYDAGLANAKFSSGPGGGWKVTSWKEI